jgi:tetratricopeptide (TPR) repeat protein
MLLLTVSSLFAVDQSLIDQADMLYESDEFEQAVTVLERAYDTASGDTERAEVLWRLSRATLGIGEALEDSEAPVNDVLDVYLRGEQYGIEAVEADPDNNLGYYWQSANVGRWGQAKGILDSLFKAGTMRDLLRESVRYDPDHAGSFYVLGQLYSEVPGFISFGNVDYAVGLARKSIDLHEAEMASGVEDEVAHDFYIQLANHLIKRNWNESRRNREQRAKAERYADASDPLERGWYYEGVAEIPQMSDRQEAADLLRRMIRILERTSDRSDGQERQLERARELQEQL